MELHAAVKADADAQICAAVNFFALQQKIVQDQNVTPARRTPQPKSRFSITCAQSSAMIQAAALANTFPNPQVFDDALLGPRFLWILQKFLNEEVWVHSPSAVSVLELYILFAETTGWLAPQNIAKLSAGQRPVELKKSRVPSMFVSEADMPTLSLCREPLGKQVTAFLQCLKFLSNKVGINFDFHRASALRVFGCSVSVQSTCLVPRRIRPRAEGTVQELFVEREYPQVVRLLWSPVRMRYACPLPEESPVVIWNRYCRNRRSAN